MNNQHRESSCTQTATEQLERKCSVCNVILKSCMLDHSGPSFGLDMFNIPNRMVFFYLNFPRLTAQEPPKSRLQGRIVSITNNNYNYVTTLEKIEKVPGKRSVQ